MIVIDAAIGRLEKVEKLASPSNRAGRIDVSVRGSRKIANTAGARIVNSILSAATNARINAKWFKT